MFSRRCYLQFNFGWVTNSDLNKSGSGVLDQSFRFTTLSLKEMLISFCFQPVDFLITFLFVYWHFACYLLYKLLRRRQ